MDLGLAGKAYCIAGGSRGLGLALAHILAAEGADLSIIARAAEPAQRECAQLEQNYGVRAFAVTADLNEPRGANEAVSKTIEHLGRIDGLAVTTHGDAQTPPFVEITDDDWHRQFEEVLLGPVRCARAVLPELIRQGEGTIVFTGAYSARSAGLAITGYAAMKAALVNLTKGLAKAHGPDGVRVNAVCPGFIATARAEARLEPLLAKGMSRGEAEAHLLASVGLAPALGRLANPREVADMIVFLLSPRASYTTGLIANIDGGTDF